jgi:hypothetical protein
MPDELLNDGPQDPLRVDVHSQWEVNYWCREFGVPPGKLRAAVHGSKSVMVEGSGPASSAKGGRNNRPARASKY